MAKLAIEDLHVRLGDNDVLKGVSVEVADGEIVALLGRSGSGKSTLLRAIAGLETPLGGNIVIGDRTMFDAAARINLPPEKRDLGLVFQSYALWPHRSVRENVAYGLKVRGRNQAEIASAVDAVLHGVGLSDLGARYPGQLSGGQQQRVALARALAYEPPLILLDEPLSNLDAKLREEARIWIREIIKGSGLTAVFVTHDQSEAMAIADRIMLLEEGRVVQEGAPEDLYTRPASLFAADFMGVNNTFTAQVDEVRGKHVRIDLAGRPVWGVNIGGRAVGEPATAVIRLERTRIVDSANDNAIAADLSVSAYLGDRWEHAFRLGDLRLRALSDGPLVGKRGWLRLPREDLWVF